jgi:hypothetical protein
MPVGHHFRHRLRRNRLAFEQFSAEKHSNNIVRRGDETVAQPCGKADEILNPETKDRADSAA